MQRAHARTETRFIGFLAQLKGDRAKANNAKLTETTRRFNVRQNSMMAPGVSRPHARTIQKIMHVHAQERAYRFLYKVEMAI